MRHVLTQAAGAVALLVQQCTDAPLALPAAYLLYQAHDAKQTTLRAHLMSPGSAVGLLQHCGTAHVQSNDRCVPRVTANAGWSPGQLSSLGSCCCRACKPGTIKDMVIKTQGHARVGCIASPASAVMQTPRLCGQHEHMSGLQAQTSICSKTWHQSTAGSRYGLPSRACFQISSSGIPVLCNAVNSGVLWYCGQQGTDFLYTYFGLFWVMSRCW